MDHLPFLAGMPHSTSTSMDGYGRLRDVLLRSINIAVDNSVGTQVASLQQVAGQLINPQTLTQPTCAPGTASTTGRDIRSSRGERCNGR